MKTPNRFLILVVDDDAGMREVISDELQAQGYKVIEAANGLQAFELVRSQNIDLVVSDIRMPGGSGIELLENLRALQKAKPAVILISGFPDLSETEAKEKGAIALLDKPFHAEQLVELTANALKII